MTSRKLRIFFLTPRDQTFLPMFFARVLSSREFDAAGIGLVRIPHFHGFLLKSISFLGWRLFSVELLRQLGIRIKNLLFRIFLPAKYLTISSVAQKNNIPVFGVKNINSPNFLRKLESMEIDLLISAACPQILKSDILKIPKKGCINIHCSLLPKYRGMYPSFWVLANGEMETGISVHYMTKAVDSGDIIYQVREKILGNDSFHSLVRRLKTDIGPKALLNAIEKIQSGDRSVIPNQSDEATYFSFPTKQDMARFLQNGRRWR